MIRRIFVAILVLFVSGSNAQDLYDVNTINTLEIEFSENNWDYLLDSLYSDGNEHRLTGTAFINGIRFDSVGVRYKGNSSYSPNNVKNPLNIKLDYIIDDQIYQDYGTLKLSNLYKDPTFIREVLSYEIARKYMPAGLANYMNVYINGSYIGLYTSVQSVDGYFTSTYYKSDDGPLFKGEIEGYGPMATSIWGFMGNDSSDYFNYYEIKSDYGWNALVDFLDKFNNQTQMINDILDVDQHLWMLAFDILMVNLDSPVNFGHNFYLYQDHSGQWNPSVWDLNENFGVFSNLLSGGPPLNLTTMQHLSPFLNISNNQYPIIQKVLTDPTWKRMYIAHMKTLIEENFENGWYLDRAEELQVIIDNAVFNDPNSFYPYSYFSTNLHTGVGNGPQTIVGIEELMEGRISYLEALAGFIETPPSISGNEYEPQQVTNGIQVTVRCTVTDQEEVFLFYREAGSERFISAEMYDDGNHNDGQAGDDIFGAFLQASAADIEYYFYAQNSDAGAFMPVRAAFEYYSIPVTSEVVINEFLASNDTTASDQDGDYDDWVELFNNGSSDISLDGWYLSDDLSDPYKWQFPDTSIQAGGYLIIWCDDDENQTGLHTSFKISASGESLILTMPGGETSDQITFGQQETDISFGRFPNGTGSFITMIPTFGAENIDESSSVENFMDSQNGSVIIGKVWPVPFSDRLFIEVENDKRQKLSLKLYDMFSVLQASLAESTYEKGQYVLEWISPNPLPDGVYILVLTNGSSVVSKKVIHMCH